MNQFLQTIKEKFFFWNKSKEVAFSFKLEPSALFGQIYSPTIDILLWSRRGEDWIKTPIVIDTGADYTILPEFLALQLGIDLQKDCERLLTIGVGGKTPVYFYPRLRVRVANFERIIPVGFLKAEIPALMGRQAFFETFETSFIRNKRIYFRE
ncbi:MAG: retropepsin-like aspartic protease [Candidatus Woesebacteria bacterium]|jgi:hypothetical protein